MTDASCMARPTLMYLNPDKYSQRYESYNTLDDLSSRICVPNKIDVNLSIFNIITRLNESKTLTKHISCKCKCKFDGRKCNSNQSWNNVKCRFVKKTIFGILVLVLLKMVNT